MEKRFDIWRDEYGVPHITSDSASGMFQGLGYAHGRDRGMQTLFMRILGQGRVSEILDSNEASLGIDTFFRKMNWTGRMAGHVEAFDPETRRIVDSYTEGLNGALSERLPWELSLLGYRLEPWKPEDSILIARMTGYLTLSQSQGEVERFFVEMVKAGVADDLLHELFPGILGGFDRGLIEKIELPEPDIVPRDLWQIGAPRMMASNNWVIAGKSTAGGSAILANDPHLETNRLPNVWYEVVMTAGERYGIGCTMPGLPGLLVGRTKRLAIGATYSFMDADDSWIEQCRNGEYFREDEGWKPFGVRTETILRKKKEPVTVTFYENPHGVLAGDPSGPDERYLLSSGWTGRDAGAESINALTEMWTVDTVEEAMGVMGRSSISFNWVYADADGSIGYQMSGKAPIRRDGVSGFVPLPGRLPENDWRGTYLPEDLPRALNPESGFIVTANQDLNRFGKAHPIDMPMAPYRADRITRLLSDETKHRADAMNRIQGDLYSLQAEAYMEFLRPLLPDTEAGEILRRWDLRYDTGSQGAFLFERFYTALRAEVFGVNGLGIDAEAYIARETGMYTDFYSNVDRVHLSESSAWFGGRSRDDLYRQAAAEALRGEIKTWGEVNRIVMNHILFGGRFPRFFGFDRGPVSLPGNRATVNQGQIYRNAGRTTTFAPSLRFAVDLGTDELHSNLYGGPSEHRFSRWYASDMKRWLSNTYKILRADYSGKRYRF